MKTDWQTKKFEDCLDKVVYANKIQRKDFLKSGLFPIVSQESEDINGYWNDEKDLFKCKKPVVIFGDHTQVLKYVDFDFVLGADGVKILQPKEILDSRFFHFFLQSADLKSLGYARHYRLLKEIDVSFPPLTEQHRIVKILDEVFENVKKAKENAEKNLQNAHELFESYLQNVFASPGDDWDEKRFNKICILQRGFDLPTRLRKQGKHPLVSSNGITDNIDAYKVKAPGVVTGRSGTIGNVHFIKKDFWPLNTALYIKEFHGNNERCIYYFLKQFDLRKYSSGAGVPTLNRNNVHSVIIRFPKSTAEQKSIVAKLNALSAETKKLAAIYKQKLADLEELKKSVLKKAFTGEF